MKFLQKVLPFILLLLIIIPAIVPLLTPGFPKTDDGSWMIIRLASFHETLRSGQFPVRFLINLNHGYGYPVLNFLYPLPFYLGEIVHLFGFGFIDSVKILFAGSLLSGSLFLYLWLKEKYGRFAALVGAVVYGYSPYHVFDIYKRGSLGEVVAFALIPLCFHFAQRLTLTKTRSAIIGLAVSLGLLILAHNVIAFLFVPLILLYSIILSWQSSWTDLKKTFIATGLGILMATFFWLPAIAELSNTVAGKTLVANYSQYFISNVNFTQLVGWGTVFIFILTGMAFARKRPSIQIIFLFIFGLLGLFFSSELSSPIWSVTPLPRLVQFPWRFLSVSVFSVSVLAAYLIQSLISHRFLSITLTIFLGIWLVAGNNWAIEKEYFLEPYYLTNDDTTTVKNEYMPRWVRSAPTNAPKDLLTLVKGDGVTLGGIVISKGKSLVQLNKVYYPGVLVYIDGVNTVFDHQSTGFPQFEVGEGEHRIIWKFTETPLRIFADLVSIFAMLAILGLAFHGIKIRK